MPDEEPLMLDTSITITRFLTLDGGERIEIGQTEAVFPTTLLGMLDYARHAVFKRMDEYGTSD